MSRFALSWWSAGVAVAIIACPPSLVGDDSRKDAAKAAPTVIANASKLRAYQQFALVHPGDPARGRELFLDEKLTKCTVCHKVGDRGNDVGPDLSRIGGKFDRPHLIESMLEPSRQIVEGYRSSVIVTADGRVETGIVKRQSSESVTLLDVNGKPRIIETEEIESREETSVSLMPLGLADVLTPAQFADLIAYLETLRAGGKVTPGAGVAGAIDLPAGFQIETIATGLTGSTALETTADGRVLVCEQIGALRVVRDGVLLEEPFLKLDVDNTWERGLIGVTVDPRFPEVPHVYVCYVSGDPFPHHRVSRFTADGDRVVPGSERILLRGDDQRKLGGSVPAGHQGGGVHFGIDGRLYIGIGEQTAEKPSQELDTFQGKILRINADGSVPKDNPFYKQAAGKYRSIWALGLRNPFTMAVHPGGDVFVNDVGGTNEEINVCRAGGNYGWPVVDHGPTEDDRFRGPLHFYPQASISGGDFSPGEFAWPAEYRDKYFFADFVHGWIKTLDPNDPDDVRPFASGLTRPVDLRFSNDGSLYVLLRNAWVIDGKFQGETGSLLRIRPAQ